MLTTQINIMRRAIFILAFLFSSMTVLAQDTEWKTFIDTAGDFTAKYPTTWVNKIKETNRVFFTSPAENSSDNFRENVNIRVDHNSGEGFNLKMSEMCTYVIEQLKPSFNEFKTEVQRVFKWNNVEACEIVYTGFYKADESIKVRMTQWFCIYKERLYTLTYTAAASNTVHTATAKKIMSSIVFK